ncbi:MAG: heparinase II/III family protein [Bacteroidales bacterium]|nr:heparinase II/III family protein [Bacteroidales bacterium]
MKPDFLALKLTAIMWMISLTACAQNEKSSITGPLPGHPRIMLLEGDEAAIKMTMASDDLWRSAHQFILVESNNIIGKLPVERVLIGRRLLDKSREALKRIFYLSYSWRMTSDSRYLHRAEKEMLAVAAFSDWNPSHFLDVAEMTMAVSIGYDWCYNGLTEESRKIIKNAILEKGLKPSLDSKNNSWLKATHNWNQVCNAGMTFGALAIYDEEKELAGSIIDRAISSIKLPMEDYQPDGAYPEGYGYWGYGTSFNIMFLSAMEKAFGSEYGLTINEGFFKTAEYLENMTGPTGNSFNYSDAGSGGGLQPSMFWLANRLSDPTLLWSERYMLQNKSLPNDRLLPAIMIWSAGMSVNEITPPAKKLWVGQGKNPVALMRSSWTEKDAVYVAIKGGSPSVNHGHMDVGSFVMEALGERWAMDFGMQDYNSLETAGVDLWNMKQNSQRWEVFRYNNLAHNTLTVNNQLQVVGGYAKITSSSESAGMINAITDISSVYSVILTKAIRGIAIVDNSYVTVRDEVETSNAETVIRWNMVTSAAVNITDNNTAVLTKNGKKLELKVKAPASVTMKTWSTVPSHSYDAANPGTIMVGFEVTVPANTKASLTVLLLPQGSVENSQITNMTLENWPK